MKTKIIVLLLASMLGIAFISSVSALGPLLLSDDFAGTTIDTTKWIVNPGYAGSSITQDDELIVSDLSLYPTYSSVSSQTDFNLAVFKINMKFISGTKWAEVMVMLTDSTTNEFGSNIHEIFIRRGDQQWYGGTWHTIPDITESTLCLFYQSRHVGNWNNEVLMATDLVEDAWYNILLEKRALNCSRFSLVQG